MKWIQTKLNTILGAYPKHIDLWTHIKYNYEIQHIWKYHVYIYMQHVWENNWSNNKLQWFGIVVDYSNGWLGMRRHKKKGIHLLSCVGVIVNDIWCWEEVGDLFQHLKHVWQILLTIDLMTHHGSGECATCAKYGVVNFWTY